jgi:hypothetical protein
VERSVPAVEKKAAVGMTAVGSQGAGGIVGVDGIPPAPAQDFRIEYHVAFAWLAFFSKIPRYGAYSEPQWGPIALNRRVSWDLRPHHLKAGLGLGYGETNQAGPEEQ